MDTWSERNAEQKSSSGSNCRQSKFKPNALISRRVLPASGPPETSNFHVKIVKYVKYQARHDWKYKWYLSFTYLHISSLPIGRSSRNYETLRSDWFCPFRRRSEWFHFSVSQSSSSTIHVYLIYTTKWQIFTFCNRKMSFQIIYRRFEIKLERFLAPMAIAQKNILNRDMLLLEICSTSRFRKICFVRINWF